MKEKQYTDFNIMFREMQDYLLENEGSLIAADSITEMKSCWFHPETKVLFSIKIRDLQKSCIQIFLYGFTDFKTRSAIDVLINDIEQLKQADAVGNVKGN